MTKEQAIKKDRQAQHKLLLEMVEGMRKPHQATEDTQQDLIVATKNFLLEDIKNKINKIYNVVKSWLYKKGAKLEKKHGNWKDWDYFAKDLDEIVTTTYQQAVEDIYNKMETWQYLRTATDEPTNAAQVMNKLRKITKHHE